MLGRAHLVSTPKMIRAAVLLAALAAIPALAQTAESSGVAVYRYTEIGQTAITVDLLSATGRSGRYLVEPGLSVLDLIVLSGGTGVSSGSQGSGPSGVVSVIRTQGGVRAVVYSATLDEVTEGGNTLPLEDKDLITIRTAAPGAITVDVWGAVGQRGRLQIEPQSTLLDVLSESGGPALGSGSADAVVVSLSRASGTGRAVVYEGTLTELATQAPPVVESGDIVTVRVVEGQRFTLRDALSVLSAATGVALLVLRVMGEV